MIVVNMCAVSSFFSRSNLCFHIKKIKLFHVCLFLFVLLFSCLCVLQLSSGQYRILQSPTQSFSVVATTVPMYTMWSLKNNRHIQYLVSIVDFIRDHSVPYTLVHINHFSIVDSIHISTAFCLLVNIA